MVGEATGGGRGGDGGSGRTGDGDGPGEEGGAVYDGIGSLAGGFMTGARRRDREVCFTAARIYAMAPE